MVVVADGIENTVEIILSAYEPTEGFSCKLFAFGTERASSFPSSGRIVFTYSKEESDNVSTSGEYGTLLIYGEGGDIRAKSVPQFKRVKFKYPTEMNLQQTINVSIPMKMEMKDEGGGGSGDMSGYVTDKELESSISRAIEEAKQYADEKVEEIVVSDITEQQIPVKNPDGSDKTISIKEAVQEVVNLQETVDSAMEEHLMGKTKDEDGDGNPDGDTVYLYTKNHIPE